MIGTPFVELILAALCINAANDEMDGSSRASVVVLWILCALGLAVDSVVEFIT